MTADSPVKKGPINTAIDLTEDSPVKLGLIKSPGKSPAHKRSRRVPPAHQPPADPGTGGVFGDPPQDVLASQSSSHKSSTNFINCDDVVLDDLLSDSISQVN